MTSDAVQNTNKLLAESIELLAFINNVDLAALRKRTTVDWEAGRILSCDTLLRNLLLKLGFVQEAAGSLTFGVAGRAFLGKLLINLEELLYAGLKLAERYELSQTLTAGKNSVTYRAHDLRLGREVVLKFFRPGRGIGIIANIPKLGRVKGDPILVNPLDFLRYSIPQGETRLHIDVVVFPFVSGVTLREYLLRERNSTPVILQAFIEQTCIALRALEIEGLHHGDLHPDNIMVTTAPDGTAAFRVIDVSFGADNPSQYEFAASDLESFRYVLKVAIQDIELRLSRISLRKHLGARLFTLVEFILKGGYSSFEQIHREIQSGDRYTAFCEAKAAFIRERFNPPHDFGILRYEELSDPNVAIRLFHPYPELFQRLCEFGSAVLFGHRGTGKSTYMAAMTFFAQADRPRIDFRQSFGILFSCRQGEFRKFSGRNLRFSSDAKLQLKDIVIIKIIRKVLASLALGVFKEKVANTKSVQPIATFLRARVQEAEQLVVTHTISQIESLSTTVLQAEINAIDRLFAGAPAPAQSKLLDENSLVEFFNTVRVSFSDLNRARFSILFDDAGVPNVPLEVQSVICDLMASTNSVYCVKLSAEKKTFEFLTSDRKPIERVHDVRVYTISDYFSLGGGFSTERKNVEDYFRELISVRLRECGFKSTNITDYLGHEAMKPDEIVSRLASQSRGEPVYGGWEIVWQIADRTMRHLLEMISAIFDESSTTPDKPPVVIPRQIQSRQILRFSGDKLRGLMFLPGTIDLGGKKRALGKMLFDFAASFGKVSAYYLHSSTSAEIDTKDKLRFDERLAIEIDDNLTLSSDAQRVLDQLIRFAVIDDEKMTTALDDGTRKPIYIFNKVYCPVLRISFRRHTHWRLSSSRFERFLVNPSHFTRTDKRLANLLNPGGDERDLFR